MLRELLERATSLSLKHICRDIFPIAHLPAKPKRDLTEDILSAARRRESHRRVCMATLNMFSVEVIRYIVKKVNARAPRRKAGLFESFIELDAPVSALVIAPASPVAEDMQIVPAEAVQSVRQRAHRKWCRKYLRFAKRKDESARIISELKRFVGDGTLTLSGLRQKTAEAAGVSLAKGEAHAFFQKHALRLLRNIAGKGRRRRRRERRTATPAPESIAHGDPLQEFLETRAMYREENLSFGIR